MTVLELIAAWTEDERKQHADLISECLKREQFLSGLRLKMKESEKELSSSLNQLLSGLTDLKQTVNANAEQIRDFYLRLVRPQGNA
jgi:hypothetical protein